MSYIVPYISSEPPPIQIEKIGVDIPETNTHVPFSNASVDVIEEASKLKDQRIEKADSISSDEAQNIMTGCELSSHIDKVMESYPTIDETDFNPVKQSSFEDENENEDERISQCSDFGQFEEYIDDILKTPQDNIHQADSLPVKVTSDFMEDFDTEGMPESDQKDNEMDFADFSQFKSFPCEVDQIDSKIVENKIQEHVNIDDNEIVEDEDEFDDFATFQNPEPTQNLVPQLDKEALLVKLKQTLIETVKGDSEGEILSEEFVNKNFEHLGNIFNNENSFQIWKELMNFDYSPAFKFQWLQSLLFEKYVNSLDLEFSAYLNFQRVAMPLYNTNLNPLQPTPVSASSTSIATDNQKKILGENSNILSQSVSASNSSIDPNNLHISGTSTGLPVSPSKANSSDSLNIAEYKTLEEEFVLNSNVSSTHTSNALGVLDRDQKGLQTGGNVSDVDSQCLSTNIVQSEFISGRMIKNMFLRQLANEGSSNSLQSIRPQTESLLKQLPDLSYMSSKVLMFPILPTSTPPDNESNSEKDINPTGICNHGVKLCNDSMSDVHKYNI